MKHYLPSLNGLRALSVIVVIFAHLRVRNYDGFNVSFPFSMIFDGSMGVSIFFVISGFLITRLLLIEEIECGRINVKNFYIRRVFRIFPAYYFLLLVYLILQLFCILHFSTTSWLSSLFYFKYLIGGDWESGHFWSLSVEEHFYLLWPALFVLFKKKRKAIAFGVIGMAMLLRLNAYQHFINIGLFDNDLSLFRRADALMIGCLFALYQDPIRRKLDSFKYQWIVSPLILILLMGFLNSDILTDLNSQYSLHLGGLLIPLGIGTSSGTATNFLIAILVIVSVFKRGAWNSFLNFPVMNYVGKLSYSLYLWQQLFFSSKIGILGSPPINIICMTIAALLSYHLVETPFLKVKNKYEAKFKDRQQRSLGSVGYAVQ